MGEKTRRLRIKMLSERRKGLEWQSWIEK